MAPQAQHTLTLTQGLLRTIESLSLVMEATALV